MVSTASLKGVMVMEVIRSASTVTSTLTSWEPRLMEEV